MGFQEFLHLIKHRLGLTPERKIEKMEKQAKAAPLLAYLDAPEEKVRRQALDALLNMAYSGRLPASDKEAVLDRLDKDIQIRQRLRIRGISDVNEIRGIAVNEYLVSDNYSMSVFSLEYALGLKPGDPGLMNNLARACSLNGDEDKAREIWRSLLTQHSDDAAALEFYAESFYREAETLFNENPTNPEIEELLLESVKINRYYPESYLLLAGYYAHNQAHDKAAESCKSCLFTGSVARDAASHAAFYGTVSLKAAEYFETAGDMAQAVDFYRRAIKAYAGDAELMENMEIRLESCLARLQVIEEQEIKEVQSRRSESHPADEDKKLNGLKAE